MKKRKKAPVFKQYDQSIQYLIPPSWDDFISENHPVRVVNSVIEKIELSNLKAEYRGGGRSSYHPKMLLKLLVYGYLSNIYSSRRLEAFANENIHCMWLTQMQMPDHNTINRFRSDRLKTTLKEIFSEVVKLLMESGHVSLQDVYIDGTKIEANANRYTFVWGNTIKYNKAKVGAQLEELWEYAESIAKEELRQSSRPDFEKVDPAMVAKTVETIDNVLKEKQIEKKIKQKLNYGKKHWAENIEKYEGQEEIMGERNSYSKTDTDATFMRMKEDHTNNAQPKAGYNVQISTNNQIVLDYSIHQKPTDTTTLVRHIEGTIELYGQNPENVIADAGYGSEENYKYLEGKGIKAYVKYNMFDKEEKGQGSNTFGAENLYYNEQQDCYYCPMGQQMRFIGRQQSKTSTGYQQTLKLYQAANCSRCPLLGVCNKGKDDNRIIKTNERLNHYRQQAKALLQSQEGIAYRKKRSIEPETVFGNMKQNKGFRRFMLRGIEKVAIETGLLYMAHNLKKAFTLGFGTASPSLI